MAVFLAFQHFNQRNSTIVPELNERLAGCDIYMTQGNPIVGTKHFLEATEGKNSLSSPHPPGIVGSGRSSVTAPISVEGGVYETPQISCCATTRALTVISSPFFEQTICTNNAADAIAAAHYFYDLGITHHGVLYNSGNYGQEHYPDYRAGARSLNIVVSVYVSNPIEKGGNESAIDFLKESVMSYFFGIFFQENVADVMDTAYSAGVAGNEEHVWIFSEARNGIASDTFTVNSTAQPKLAAALDGVGLVLLRIPQNEDYITALKEFKGDKELQKYYVSRHTEPAIFGRV